MPIRSKKLIIDAQVQQHQHLVLACALPEEEVFAVAGGPGRLNVHCVGGPAGAKHLESAD